VAPKKPEIFARFARKVLGVVERDDRAAALGGVEAYIGWLRKVGAPQTYFDFSSSLEFTDTELNIVADNAWRIYKGKIGRLYPIQRHEIEGILKEGRKVL